MAPKVQVPMDFGVKYLESPSHCNLKFNLREGGQIPANSMIISYNSPVIESLTTDLMQTSVDVDDFSKEAVQCFLESCYSGDLQKITKTNFRDVNKMAKVFEVSWVTEKCSVYFQELVDELDHENYEEQLYLFQEAMFVWVTLKCRKFVEVVVEKFSSEIAVCDRFFVSQFLDDLSSHSHKQLDVVIEMVGEQKQVLLEVLNNDIGKKSDCFSANSRYLLENVSFTKCYSTHKALYESMFEKIEALKTPSREDFGMMMRLFKQSDADKSVLHASSALNCTSVPLPCCKFLRFCHLNDLSGPIELVDFLATVPFVCSSYILFDAVYCWVFEKSHNGNNAIVHDDTTFSAKFINLISERDWKPLVPEYLEGKSISCLTNLITKIKRIPAFKSYTNYYRLLSDNEYSPEEFFQQDNDIKFYFPRSNNDKCGKEEKCGFILRTTALFESMDDSFDIKLVIDPKSYPNDHCFHNQGIDVANMHIAMKINNSKKDYPVSWSGKPTKDKSNNYYLWGQYQFFSNDEGTSPGGDFTWGWIFNSKAKIRLVIYHFG